MKSGVPQITVLGPLMFLLCINTISDSTVWLFADDCVVYRAEQDLICLQRDLNTYTMANATKHWQNINV